MLIKKKTQDFTFALAERETSEDQRINTKAASNEVQEQILEELERKYSPNEQILRLCSNTQA